ncbi:hypothetical protein SAMN05216428_10692 [Nitrosospira sp. Nsp11]|nr:hypothetical protein SAMN05216428_10692 [Nitrosospira sp. Nsp11]
MIHALADQGKSINNVTASSVNGHSIRGRGPKSVASRAWRVALGRVVRGHGTSRPSGRNLRAEGYSKKLALVIFIYTF